MNGLTENVVVFQLPAHAYTLELSIRHDVGLSGIWTMDVDTKPQGCFDKFKFAHYYWENLKQYLTLSLKSYPLLS